MLVRAKVAHLEPPSGAYRQQGEEFDHDGKPYKHVEVVKQPAKEKQVKVEPEAEEAKPSPIAE